MTQYIDKSALVAEIESKRKYAQVLGDNAINSSMQQFYDGMKQGCVDLLSFLDTLEVKEVDLDEEFDKYDLSISGLDDSPIDELFKCAKHFFELGLSHSIDESIVRKIIDLYFEASKHYDEVIKQERYRTGGSQLAIDILDGSKDMKELCIQYVLDKVTKEIEL